MSDWAFVREQIKERLSLSGIVGRKVRFDARKSQPARGDFWACCPFHSEKSPSFHVVDREGFYKCFGCGASGDHFTFVMETENCSIAEATERLAAEAGVEMPKRGAHAERQERQRISLYDILERAAAYFEDQLKTEEGEAARDYLRRRGVPVDLWGRFRLGYAPSDGQALLRHMAAAGISAKEVREAGLLGSREEPSALLRGRLTFAISDSRSRVIAFGGRALREGAQPKYLNTGDSPVFHKSRALYNVGAARGRPSRSGEAGPQGAERLIVVEGYMDVIALTAAGFPRALAPLGTALTEDHIKILWQIEPAPVLCLDGDEAGKRAAERAVARALPLLKPGRTLDLAYLPAGQDPDDLLKASGAAAFSEVVKAATPLAPALWQAATQGADLTLPDERARIEAALAEACAQIADPLVRRHYEGFVRDQFWQLRRPAPAGRGGARRDTWGKGDKWDKGARRGGAGAPAAKNWRIPAVSARPGGGAAAEKVFVALIIANPGVLDHDVEALAMVPLLDPSLDKLRNEIIHIAASGEGLDRQGMMDRLAEHGLGAEAKALLGSSGFTCLAESRPGTPVEEARRALSNMMKLFSVRSDMEASVSAVKTGLSEEAWARARRLKVAAHAAQRDAVDVADAESEAQSAPKTAGDR